jgi:hypothetical protein
MSRFEQLKQERKVKIDETMARYGPKIFTVIPWEFSSNTIRWFPTLKEAVDAGKKIEEEDAQIGKKYDINIFLHDGTATRLTDREEIEQLLETEVKYTQIHEEQIALSNPSVN